VIVCHCRVVSDRAVHAAISAGAATLDDVAILCGAGAECGGCAPSVEALLAEAAIAIAAPERIAERQRQRRVAAGAPAFAPAG
jgi:bacterioferritin-associated ferredoxin